jgi:hypothetical protein
MKSRKRSRSPWARDRTTPSASPALDKPLRIELQLQHDSCVRVVEAMERHDNTVVLRPRHRPPRDSLIRDLDVH